MRAWFLTNTTYGTWLPGDERGSITSVRDRRPGDELSTSRIEHDRIDQAAEPSIPGLEACATNALKCPPIYLNLSQAEDLLAQFQETADHRKWTLRAVAIMANHFHVVVTVEDDPDPDKIIGDFKAYGTRRLSRNCGAPASKTWWTHRGSTRKLNREAAIEEKIRYVLYEQEFPLVVWSPETGRIV